MNNPADNNEIFIKSRPLVSVTDFSIDEIIDFIRNTLIHRGIEACYLFGSVATGKTNPWSDIDVLIITQSSRPFIERPLDFQELFELSIPVDIIVYTSDEFEKVKRSTCGFGYDINKGMIRVL